MYSLCTLTISYIHDDPDAGGQSLLGLPINLVLPLLGWVTIVKFLSPCDANSDRFVLTMVIVVVLGYPRDLVLQLNRLWMFIWVGVCALDRRIPRCRRPFPLPVHRRSCLGLCLGGHSASPSKGPPPASGGPVTRPLLPIKCVASKTAFPKMPSTPLDTDEVVARVFG